MPSRLSQHFRQQRLQGTLSLGDIARAVGYNNAGKGANRIQKFEQKGDIHPDLLAKLGDQPIRPHLIVRLLPAVYLSEQLPADIKPPEEAETFASARAKHW